MTDLPTASPAKPAAKPAAAPVEPPPGGTALKGGAGRVWGTICGAFILELVGNIMLLSNFISEYLIGAIQGTIIIIAMLVQRSLARKA